MVPAAFVDDTVAKLGAAARRPTTRSSTAATPTTATTCAAPRRCGEQGLHYVDMGTSGGVFGLERGYCLMIGGDDKAVERLDPFFSALAPGVDAAPRTPGREGDPAPAEQGYLHCGPAGAGHFVKMVHNGIEYGMMAAYAEGLNILERANIGAEQQEHDAETTPLRDPEAYMYDLPIAEIAEVWRRGSVVASWLLDLTAQALRPGPQARGLLRPRLGLRRGPLDRAGRRSTRACPRRSSPRASTRASSRAARASSATARCRRCASASAGTWRRAPRSFTPPPVGDVEPRS